jgi:hypothetical protein
MGDDSFQNTLQQPNALLRIAEAGGFCVGRKSHGGFAQPFRWKAARSNAFSSHLQETVPPDEFSQVVSRADPAFSDPR